MAGRRTLQRHHAAQHTARIRPAVHQVAHEPQPVGVRHPQATQQLVVADRRPRLEAGNARYEQWSADTHATRNTAGKAAAELQRRGHVQPDGEPHRQLEDEPQQIAGWRHQLEADAKALNHADAGERQGVRDAGEPWLSQRTPDIDPASVPRPDPETRPEIEPSKDDGGTRLDELLARADQAAQRIAAQQAERQASSEYAVRMELKAQAQAEASQQAEARDEVELELLRSSSSVLPD